MYNDNIDKVNIELDNEYISNKVEFFSRFKYRELECYLINGQITKQEVSTLINFAVDRKLINSYTDLEMIISLYMLERR